MPNVVCLVESEALLYTAQCMAIEELLSLNEEGFFPGPDESEECFLARVKAAKEKFFEAGNIPIHDWQWASERTRALFGFAPKWCKATLSAKGLTPWQAAATWIDVNRFYIIQINPSRWVQKLIDRDELLAHEASHAARVAFDEPIYEEIFAYLTSNAKWRQVLGAFFRRPFEVWALLGLFGGASVLQIAEILWPMPLWSPLFFWAGAGLCFFWSMRLLRARLRLQKASKRLLPLLREPSFLLPTLFRLTDAEVHALACGEGFEGEDLRWQMLKVAYFKGRSHG